MADIDGQELLDAVLAAMKGVFAARWPKVRVFARVEAKVFLTQMAEIGRLKAIGEIEEDEAAVLTRMHTRAMESVLLTIEGVSLALAEQAVNGAMAAVRTQINNAIGWTLL